MPTDRPDHLDPLLSLICRAERLLERIEPLLPEPAVAPDFTTAHAFRWRKINGRGRLVGVPRVHAIQLEDLLGIDDQKARLLANTRQFVAGRPANNALLTGARGSGKSSIIKALLNALAPRGLRLIEVDKDDLIDLPDIVAQVETRPERFIVYCDDLSFEAGDPSYKALKVVLDGALAAAPDNLLIYATSNRRHLMPEFFAENLDTHRVDDEVHPGEATEEKISLSERFGLWLSFYPFDQDGYLAICTQWLRHFGVDDQTIADAEREALNWALGRGSRSGRVAWQFARDFAGRQPVRSNLSPTKTARPRRQQLAKK